MQFIADLRNARARELEEKRINKELANIRCVGVAWFCSKYISITDSTMFCRQKFKGRQSTTSASCRGQTNTSQTET